MADVPETHRPSSQPVASTRPSHRCPWSVTRSTRFAAILLLLVWVGPVTLEQTDSWRLLRLVGAPERASAETQVIPAGMAMLLQPKTILRLRLRDGGVLEGRFLARTLLDSTLYASRFAARGRSSSFVPFALGETLHVSLRDGREWTAPFAGYAELTMLLRSPDGPEYLRVPFESAREISGANGDRVEPSALTRAFHEGLLPSAEALSVEKRLSTGYSMASPWARAQPVAVEDIVSATAELSPGTNVAGVIVLSVVLGVVVGLVLLGIAVNSAVNSASNSCGSPPPGSLWGVHLTTRPFDRSRGCYVGDPLAVADPWPGSTVDGPATALADPVISHAIAK